MKDKNDRLHFSTQPLRKKDDTTFIISLVFFDDASFSLYSNQLSILNRQPISKSLAYSYTNTNKYGFEYILSPELIAGLTTEALEKDQKLSHHNKIYHLYLYSIIDKNSRLYKLSDAFK